MLTFVGVSGSNALAARSESATSSCCSAERKTTILAASAMGSSLAPRIRISDTGSDSTRKIEVSSEAIAPSNAASTILANSALFAAMARRGASEEDGDAASSKPEGMSSADFYYPSSSRDVAPVISIESDGVKVSFEPITASVSGRSTSSKPKPFWAQSTLKNYTAPSSADEAAEAPIDDAAFVAYFPARVRNLAPEIQIQSPLIGGGGAFVTLESTRAKLNTALADQILEKYSEKKGADEE